MDVDATSGIWHYQPTQGETDNQSLKVAIYKANCTSAAATILFGEAITEPLKVDVDTVKERAITCDQAITIHAILGQDHKIGTNASGDVLRVVLVDTTTANSDMRGTDNAALTATALSNVVWTDAKAGFIDAAISSRHAAGAAVAKSPATLDWDADVSNKPTIGTSTFDPTTDEVTTDTASRDASKATGFATPTNVADARDAIITQGDSAWGTYSGADTPGTTTLLTVLSEMAPVIRGTITGAGTGTEVFTHDGVTVTVTVDAQGNRSAVVVS